MTKEAAERKELRRLLRPLQKFMDARKRPAMNVENCDEKGALVYYAQSLAEWSKRA